VASPLLSPADHQRDLLRISITIEGLHDKDILVGIILFETLAAAGLVGAIRGGAIGVAIAIDPVS
jgi:hypothetical protein